MPKRGSSQRESPTDVAWAKAQSVAAEFVEKFGEEEAGARYLKSAVAHIAVLATIPTAKREGFCAYVEFLCSVGSSPPYYPGNRDKATIKALRAAQDAVRRADKALRQLSEGDAHWLAEYLLSAGAYQLLPLDWSAPPDERNWRPGEVLPGELKKRRKRRNRREEALRKLAYRRWYQHAPKLMSMFVHALAEMNGENPQIEYGARRARGTKSHWLLRKFLMSFSRIVSANGGRLTCYRNARNELCGDIVEAIEALRPLISFGVPLGLPAKVIVESFGEYRRLPGNSK